MNSDTILSLISDLYSQVVNGNQRVAMLERENAQLREHLPDDLPPSGTSARTPGAESDG